MNYDKKNLHLKAFFACFCDPRDATTYSRPWQWGVPEILAALWPPLLPGDQCEAGFLLARLATPVPADAWRAGVGPQQSRGGVHPDPQFHQAARPVDRPNQGQQL